MSNRVIIITALTLACVCADVQPPKTVYATFMEPGPQNSLLEPIAVDAAGFLYVPGVRCQGQLSTASLTKLNQSGTAPLWSVCLPLVAVTGLVLGNSGSIYIVGSSLDPSWPVVKLSPDGKDMTTYHVAGTYPLSVTIDSSEKLYIVGGIGVGFQPTIRAADTKSSTHGFAMKLDPDGTVLWASNLDIYAYGIAVDSLGQPWIVGTSCRNDNCEGLAMAVRKLDINGAEVLVARSMGGAGPGGLRPTFSDSANAVAVDSEDSVWIVGRDTSGGLPTTPNAVYPQRTNDNSPAGYVFKMSAAGELQYATYIDGYAQEAISTVALDGLGNPYFTVVNSGLWSTIWALTSDGSHILISTKFASEVSSLVLDGNGGLYVAGIPLGGSSRCPTTTGAYRTTTKSLTVICAARLELSQSGDSEVFVPLNAASLQPASVSPGELIRMSGVGLPQNPVVSFDGLLAPIVTAEGSQITAVVPFGIKPGWTALDVAGVGGYTLGVWPSAPGLFTMDGTGAGQLDARNADGTVNSSDQPAAAGSVVTLFMTGAGSMVPPTTDGSIGPAEPPYPTPTQAIYVAINGSPANVVSAYQAPGKIGGIVQVNLQIPADVPSGDAVVRIGVGGSGDAANFPFQLRTTIAVR